MSFTLCTSGAIIHKAGANVNVNAAASGALLAEWCDAAEGFIVTETRREWVTQYASLSTGVKGMLADVCSSLAATNLVNYDMSGYTSRQEATTILDVLRDNFTRGLSALKDFNSNDIKNP
jgi:hypothetical protein